MIYELRIYRVIPGKNKGINDRFANHTMRLFQKHDIQVVGFWETIIGEHNFELVYIVAFNDLNHRQAAWDAFVADPEWQQAKAESERDGPLVSEIHNKIMRPTSYSPLQ